MKSLGIASVIIAAGTTVGVLMGVESDLLKANPQPTESSVIYPTLDVLKDHDGRRWGTVLTFTDRFGRACTLVELDPGAGLVCETREVAAFAPPPDSLMRPLPR